MPTNGAQTNGLGPELKRRREERAIELQEISNATRIGLRYLRAIEENDFKALPGGLFTRSFIKTYARYVGMDEGLALQQFLDETNQGKDPTGRYDIALDSVRKQARQTFWATMGIVLSILLVLGMAVAGGWHFWQRMKASDDPVVPVSPPATSSLPASQSPQTPPGTESGDREGGAQTELSAPAESPVSANPPADSGDPEETTRTSADQSLLEGPIPPPARPPMEIRLEATDVCWVSVTSDQGRVQRETLRAGETRSFKPQQQVELSASNLAHLRVLINGKLARFSSYGPSVRGVVISRENYQQFLRR